MAGVTATFDIKTKSAAARLVQRHRRQAAEGQHQEDDRSAPLTDALGKALNSASVTDGLNQGLVLMYNAKDKEADGLDDGAAHAVARQRRVQVHRAASVALAWG